MILTANALTLLTMILDLLYNNIIAGQNLTRNFYILLSTVLDYHCRFVKHIGQ